MSVSSVCVCDNATLPQVLLDHTRCIDLYCAVLYCISQNCAKDIGNSLLLLYCIALYCIVAEVALIMSYSGNRDVDIEQYNRVDTLYT